MLSKADAHSKRIAGSAYVTKTATADNNLGTFTHDALADAVAWPSAGELERLKDEAMAMLSKHKGIEEQPDPKRDCDGDEVQYLIRTDAIPVSDGGFSGQVLAIEDGSVDGEPPAKAARTQKKPARK